MHHCRRSPAHLLLPRLPRHPCSLSPWCWSPVSTPTRRRQIGPGRAGPHRPSLRPFRRQGPLTNSAQRPPDPKPPTPDVKGQGMISAGSPPNPPPAKASLGKKRGKGRGPGEWPGKRFSISNADHWPRAKGSQPGNPDLPPASRGGSAARAAARGPLARPSQLPSRARRPLAGVSTNRSCQQWRSPSRASHSTP